MARITTPRLALITLVALGFSLSGCFEVEGVDAAADENQEQAGWQDRGRDPGTYSVTNVAPDGAADPIDDGSVKPDPGTTYTTGSWSYTLGYSDVILSPDGEWLLAMVPVPGPNQGWEQPGLVLVAQALPGGERLVFPSQRDLARINFAPDGSVAYLLQADHHTVWQLDFASMSLQQVGSFQAVASALDVSPDGRHLIGTNLPTTDLAELFFQETSCEGSEWLGVPEGGNRCELSVLDTMTGESWRKELALPLRDVDAGYHEGEIITTMGAWDEDGMPESILTFVDLAKGDVVAEVTVPNCADELKIQPGGNLGLLSPTVCNTLEQTSADPISVIDLEARAFLTNLPGFGPVVISDDGTRAVGFTRKADMAEQWSYWQEEQVGLIVVDLPALTWHVVEYGDAEPAYHLAADGRHLYTYEPNLFSSDAPIFLVDLVEVTIEPVAGPDIGLRKFVEARDQGVLYAIHDSLLVSIVIGETKALPLPVAFEGDLMNIRPQGDMLVIGEEHAPAFTLVPLDDPTATTELVLSATD